MSAVINTDSGGSLSVVNAYFNRQLVRTVKMDEEREDTSGWMNVISNSVIIRRLEKYISYNDFKACRLVCRAFERSIVENSSFASRTKLIIKKETLRSGIFSQLSFALKNVDVYLFEQDPTRKESLEPLYRCFSSVESLKLEDEHLKPENFTKVLPEVDGLVLHDGLLRTDNFTQVLPDVNRLIRATESLKELQMSTWDVNLFLNLERSEEVIEKLKDVASLELIPHFDLITYGLKEEGLREIQKLHTVKIQDGYTDDKEANDELSEAFRAMRHLVVRSVDTITSLKISEPYMWTKFSDADTNYICDTHFPKLRELRIRATEDEANEISTFLAAHGKQLDSLGIRILGEFPCDVIDVIRQHTSKKIKKLTIATNAFDQSRPRNLAFLEDFQELESFKLQFIFSNMYIPNGDSAAAVFSFLPTKNLRKLSLIRLPTQWNESLDHLKIEALSALRYLALDWCGKAVTDETINAMFKHMTQLEYLRIKHALECGVKGFTGTENAEDPTPEPGKVAASNLTRLKHLVLQHCGVDDHIIKVALKFKDLRILDISGNGRVTDVSCAVAVSQNPSLVILRTDNFSRKIDMKVLQSVNARFKFHKLAVREDDADPLDHDPDSSDEEIESNDDPGIPWNAFDMMDDIEAEPVDEDDYDFDPHPEDYELEMVPEEYDFVNPEDYDYYFMHDENDGNGADDEYDAFED